MSWKTLGDSQITGGGFEHTSSLCLMILIIIENEEQGFTIFWQTTQNISAQAQPNCIKSTKPKSWFLF